MAESNQNEIKLVQEVKTLLWGSSVKEEVFERWAQGFYFSDDEPTALVQAEGGPCAVIAPVQAFIMKRLLQENITTNWSNMPQKKCDELFVKAVTEIIEQAADCSTENAEYSLVYMENSRGNERLQGAGTSQESSTGEATTIIPSEFFHSCLRILVVKSIGEVENFLTENLKSLKDSYGILLLLYTIVFTKGIDKVRLEISDPTEPIIDSTYGYGSQSLINLMLTGRAVSHVWDYDQDVGGLKLRGIERQNTVGFLALLEHLRYCEVGSFLKSPANPVWVLGSETHLTVLFSEERRLVSPETPAEQARRVFKKYDPEGNNFISANLLQDVLAELDLVADIEYVDIMRKKMDSENLGIILLASFMDEFFPEEPQTCPDTFVIYHYNGLRRSNVDNKVRYHKGQCVLLECNIKSILDSNPMLTVLQTKWPNIEVQWDMGRTPSLN